MVVRVPWAAGVPGWHSAYAEAAECARLDEELHKLDAAIRRHLPLLNKCVAARVRAWLRHLGEPAPTLAWRRGRNAHAAALNAALARGRLPPPFDALPPRDQPPGAQLPLAAAVAAGVTARRARKARPPRTVPGTRLRLPAATAAPPHLDACTAALAPSHVELAAALGAARERSAELESRLADAEARLAAATAAAAARQDASAALGKAAARLQARVEVMAGSGGAAAVATPPPPRRSTPATPARQSTQQQPRTPPPPVDLGQLRARIAKLKSVEK